MAAPVAIEPRLSDEELSRLWYERFMRDKSYELLPLGGDAAAYLRIKRKRMTQHSLDAYESTLNAFCRTFAFLELKDFEPPVGTERIEEWLDREWGRAKPATYNRHLAVMRDFFKVQVMRGRLVANPMLNIQPAKKRQFFRESYSISQVRAILAAQESRRDYIALALLLHYGLRRGALQAVQFKHFDYIRKQLTVFSKGGTVRPLPIPEAAFWHDLERHIIEAEAQPGHYLMTARFANRYGAKDIPDKRMSGHGLQKWWYRCLRNAGITEEGQTSGERMHKARHTAGQIYLDHTRNLKGAQMLLGHSSIQTTGDLYVGWDTAALAADLSAIYGEEDDG